jgi:SAM-dependent methyltransferase
MGGYALRLSEAEVVRYRMMAEQARVAEGALWQQAGITTGAHVADIGCGPGAVLPVLAEVVGPTGSVSAVDGDADAVAAARALVTSAGLKNVEVRHGAADATGLEPASFDAITMRHVLAHNAPTEQAIVDHLATLVRPGGCVYLLDIDAHAMRTRGADPALEDLNEKYLAFHRSRGNDLQPGLRLDLLLRAAGLDVVAYRGWYGIITPPAGARSPAWAAREAMVDAGIATQADLARWDAAFARSAEHAAQVTIFAPLFAAIGKRRG